MDQPLLARGKGAIAVSVEGDMELICKLDVRLKGEGPHQPPATFFTFHPHCRDVDLIINTSVLKATLNTTTGLPHIWIHMLQFPSRLSP